LFGSSELGLTLTFCFEENKLSSYAINCISVTNVCSSFRHIVLELISPCLVYLLRNLARDSLGSDRINKKSKNIPVVDNWNVWLFISIPMLIVTALLPFLISDVDAITMNNTDFSLTVLDNWAYTDQEDPIASILGVGPSIGLIPNEFSHILLNASLALTGNSIKDEGAYSIFALDRDYPYRNIPLETYTQYNINLSAVKIFSQENTTIDGENAVKIHRSPRNNLTNIEVVDYYLVHNSKPYYIQYAANVKDFQKYLPEFEQMVKTFKFKK